MKKFVFLILFFLVAVPVTAQPRPGTGTGPGSGGAGDASAAKQDEQTALLTTIDADTGGILTATQTIDNLVHEPGATDATPASIALVYRQTSDDTLIGVTDASPLPVDIGPAASVSVASLPADATELPAAVADGDNTTITSAPHIFAALKCWDSTGSNWDRCVSGDATHDSAAISTGPQIMVGALAFGADPTAVTAGDAVRISGNRDGIPFMLGGHPNIQTIESQVQDADGAQTDLALVTCGAGCKVVVTFAKATCDPDTTDDTSVRLGFGTANVPAGAHTGTAGVVLANDGVVPGGGEVSGNGTGIIGVGADGEDLRLTIADPTGGSCNVLVKYFTIES